MDLSVGSIVGVCGIVCGMLLRAGQPIVLSILASIAAGAAVGFVNGVIVGKLKIQAVVVTIGTQVMFRGLCYIMTSGRAVSGYPLSFFVLGTGDILGLPISVLVLAACYLGAWFVLERTYLGRYILAIGNNQNTTRYSGIRVDRVKMLLFVFCGVMTAIASVFLISRLSSAEATLGSGYELDIITAALIGGIDINGGSGKLQVTFLGILIIGILRNGLNLMGLSVIYQSIILGVLLLVAVAKRKSRTHVPNGRRQGCHRPGRYLFLFKKIRRTNMKKAIAIILAAGMMLAMAACGATPASSTGTSAPAGSSSAQGQATRTYFINPKMVGAAYWETAKEGAMQAGEDLGVEVIWNGTSEVDVAKQINMVTDMITRQVDGIAVAVNDATSMTNVFNQAKEASIPVVTFDSDSENAERAYCILPDTDEAIGEAFLAALINQMPEPKGKVAVMIASPSAANIIAWRDAALAKIEKDYPDIEIVGVYPSNDDQQKAYENAKSFIQANPDLSGILCLAAAETPAACKAVQEAVEAGQLEEGQVKIGGMGMPSLVREYLKDGTMSESVIWNPASMGYLAVWTLDQLAQGNEIKDGAEVPGVGTIKVDGDRIYCGTFTFTADDVDNYQF